MIPFGLGGARRVKKVLALALGVVLLGVWFDAAYVQQPLYTSNQNTYLLHGLALAGRGLLRDDWLVQTADPTPFFTRLVAWSYALLPEKAFYAEHTLLSGVYVFALVGLAMAWHRRRARVSPRRARSGALALAAVLVALHSTAGEGLLRLGNQPWSYHLHEGLAGQDVLSRIYQPSAFGVLLILSIWLFLRGRPVAAAAAASFAATVHPTYMLSAAALDLGYLIVLLRRGHLRRAAQLCAAALALTLPIAVYTIATFRATTPALMAAAYRLLVHARIPHHALPSVWLVTGGYVRIGIVVAALVFVRRSRLFPVLVVPFLVALGLTVLDIVRPDDALALLFPWRISVFLVPIATTLLLSTIVFRLTAHRSPRLAALLFVAAAALPTEAGIRQWPAVIGARNDTQVTSFIAARRRPGQRYLIPLAPTAFDRFRILISAPILVDRKSHPYRDVEILEWERRNELAGRFYGTASCHVLDEIVASYGITHVVAPWRQAVCAGWARVFDDRQYAVWTRRP